MRLTLIFLIASLWQFSNAQVKSSCKYVKVKEATQRRWSPGIVQKNSAVAGGLIYEITVAIKGEASIGFHRLVMNGNSIPLEVAKGETRNFAGPYHRKDLLTLRARTNDSEALRPPEKEVAELTKGKKGKAWIQFSANGQVYLCKVKKIRETAAKLSQ